MGDISALFTGAQITTEASNRHSYNVQADHSTPSVGLERLPSLQQRFQAGENAWPSVGASRVSGIILGPFVMRHGYFRGFGLGHQFDRRA